MMTKEEAVAEIDLELKACVMSLETCRDLSTGAVDDKGAFAAHLRSIEALKMARRSLLSPTFANEVCGLPLHITCPECKGKQYKTVLTPGSDLAPAEQVECKRCGGDGYLPVFTIEQVEKAVRAWVADVNVILADWNDAVQRGDKPSMSIMYEPGGVWEWIRQRLASQQGGGKG